MPRPKKAEPHKIELTEDEIKSLRERIAQKALTDEDIALFDQVLLFMLWLQAKIGRFQLSMHRLRALIFGKKTEKMPKKNVAHQNKGARNSESSSQDTGIPEEKPKQTGHGRLSQEAYVPDEVRSVFHESLQSGDFCPQNCGGRLYLLEDNSGSVIRVKGQSCAHVIRYEFQRLRCALCGAVFTAAPPADFPTEKYDAYFKANLVFEKYFMGTPFYRKEQQQKLLGFPLPDSTQWDLVESVADSVYPVLCVLEKKAANGTHLNHDDTPVKILDVMRANQVAPSDRKGTYTTCLLAQSDEHKICLYYSGRKHSGENVSALLGYREKNLPPIIRMCDALAANLPKNLETIVCHCLAHGRRKFKDIEPFFPAACDYVIGQLAKVYHHDALTKQMTPEQRLIYHQTHSGPIIDALKQWMQTQFEQREVEPNSALGAAITYMQKRWHELTRFLSIPGAHLDNNLVERALKLAIRTRKNAMFHRSEHGAFVCGLFLSLISTCALALKNPIRYLVALQHHRSHVRAAPDLWLPWNYEEQLGAMGFQSNGI